jgi:putative DNA primase/helicase
MYGEVPGLLQVWTYPAKGAGEFFSTDEEGIEQAVTSIEASYELGGQQSIYARITTMKGIPAKKDSRGYAIDSQSFIGLWTDLDFGTVGHEGENLPPTAEEAQKVYDASGLPEASITVHSGGGLYHIVKLAEPLDITDAETRMRISALSRRWHHKVKAAAEKLGYNYGTGAHDLARVLRVPGTVNAKDWNNRRPTAFMSSGARYTLAELEAACPAPPKPERRAPQLTGEPAKDARARFEHHLAEMRACTFERNNTLNRLAFMSFQYAGAGQLNEADVEREFTSAGLDSGLEESEVRATVNSAKKGLEQPFVWKDFTRAPQAVPQAAPEDPWAGQLDDAGQVVEKDAPAPRPVPEPAVQGRVQAPPQTVQTAAQTPQDEPVGEKDALSDSRLPAIVEDFRVPSDKKPYSVAVALRDAFFLHNGKPTLMRWQDMWVRWDGASWNVMSDADITAWLYQRMDAAYMAVQDKETKEWTEAPWNPGNSNITNLDKALRAAVNLRDDTKQNTMIGEGVHDLAVSCTNGLLRVTGRELAPADPAYFTFSSVPFAYDRNATCPQWEEWLADTFAHDPDTVAMIQEWFGYVVSGRTDMQKALLLQGVERSGKGTIARILQRLAGPTNSCGPTLNSLTEQFGLWALTDKMLAVIGDARLPKKGTEVITERLLSITGEDTINVDRKWQRPWEGKIPARIVLLSNEIPNWADSAGVLPTRFIVATTVKSYLGNEDPTLFDRLASEMPGILNWALDGLDRLVKQGKFTVNAATPEIVGAQRDRSAPQKGFVEEVCVLGGDKWVSKERLREMWVLWNQEHGRTVADTRESFTTKLLGMVPTIQARDQKKRINGKLTPIFRGIALRIDHPELIKEEDKDEEIPDEPGPVQEILPGSAPQVPPVENIPAARNGTQTHSYASALHRRNRTINPTAYRSEEDRQ